MHTREPDNRTSRRFMVEGMHGNMHFTTEVRILNLSDGGAAIEAEKRMNIGGDYTLKLQNEGTSFFAIHGVVVWSSITHSKNTEQGESVPIYHAGMQFKDLSSEQSQSLKRFLDTHKIARQKRLSGVRFIIRGDHTAVVSYPFDYEIKTLSMGGMLIRANQSFDAEQRFRMEISLDHKVSINFTGRIASCLQKLEGGRYFFDVGIAFEDVDDKVRTSLEEYLRLLEMGEAT